MHQCSKFILFWNDTLHVSDGLSVHQKEFKTVHTATGICQTDTAVCLLAGMRWNYINNITMHGPMNVKFGTASLDHGQSVFEKSDIALKARRGSAVILLRTSNLKNNGRT